MRRLRGGGAVWDGWGCEEEREGCVERENGDVREGGGEGGEVVQ